MSALVSVAIAMFAARLFLLGRMWRLPQRHGEVSSWARHSWHGHQPRAAYHLRLGGILPGAGLDGLDGAVEPALPINFKIVFLRKGTLSNSRALAVTAKGAIDGLAAPQAPGSFVILRASPAASRVLNHQSLLSADQGL